MPTISFVSGASGYIALHLSKLLLSKGHRVVGSVRTQSKGEHLKNLLGTKFDYAIVPDVSKPGAFDEALKTYSDISYFYHTAAPVQFVGRDLPINVHKPVTEGIKSAINSVHNYSKNVKRFIYTASILSVTTGMEPVKSTITEDNWTNFNEKQIAKNGIFGYSAAKVAAERYGFKFVEDKKPKFDFVSINPSFVFGPQAFDSEVKDTLNLSAEIVNAYLKLKPTDAYPPFQGTWFDVRDVAKAHFIASESKDVANKRLVLANDFFYPQRIANILRDNFPELETTIKKGNPSFVASNPLKVDFSNTHKLLNFEPIPFETSVIDAAGQALEYRKIRGLFGHNN